ncbi:hypothetical protein F5B20DRAFT_518509 [Whalleya microplaca]|nr:hypothetical protein F5B20DRAFT_518509 [Whalleya microplaca]
MAPVQNTFSIIPNAPADIDGDRPARRPMTTKQAKKAYQKANKGPKLSKAEQRRQELFEQDRIRREFEKERNQARARTARDKKREKEEKERAEKKKKGLPLVEVHPSQDTIARFIFRGNAKKPASDAGVRPDVVPDDDSDSHTLTAEDDDDDEDEDMPPPKRPRIETPDNVEPAAACATSSAAGVGGSASPIQDHHAKELTPEVVEVVKQRSSPRQASPEVAEADIDELVHLQLLGESFGAPSSPPREKVQDDESASPQGQDVPVNLPSPKTPACPPRSPITAEGPSQEQKAGESAALSPIRRPLQPLSAKGTNARTFNARQKPMTNRVKPAMVRENSTVTSPKRVSRKLQQPVPASRSFRHPRTPMGPPPVPPKFKSPGYTPEREPRTPHFLFKQPQVPNSHSATESGQASKAREEQPPMSTQAFMFNHLDDFLPSPSQEMRELFEDTKVNSTIGGSKTRTKRAVRPLSEKHLSTGGLSSISSFNLSASTATGSVAESNRIGDVISCNQPNTPHTLPANAQSSGATDPFDIPFFSTQDFVLSSQDMKDLEEETSSAVEARPAGSDRRSKIRPDFLGNSSLETNQGRTSVDSKIATVPKSIQRLDFNQKGKSSNRHDHSAHPQVRTSISRTTNSPAPYHPARDVSNTTPAGSPPHWPKRTKNVTRNMDGAPSQDKPSGTARAGTKQVTKSPGSKVYPVPHPSPKPFFASSGREAHYKYIIERSKTSVWEGATARQKAQEELEQLRRSENERGDQLLLEGLRDEEVDIALEDYADIPEPKATTHSQPRSQAHPQTVNSLSSQARKNTHGQGTKEGNADPRPRNRQRSSYNEMLELLEREKAREKERNSFDEIAELLERDEQDEARFSFDGDMAEMFECEAGRERERERNKGQARASGREMQIAASQETDYGDAGLDDVLCEIL